MKQNNFNDENNHSANKDNLPSSWMVATLEHLAQVIYRYPTFYGMEHLDAGVPVIRGEHINSDGTISHDWSDYWYISPDLSQEFPNTILQYQDLVMSVRGSVGKMGIVDDSLIGAQLSPNCIRISLQPCCHARFILYYLKSGKGQESIAGSVNATTIQTIKSSALKQTVIPLAPLNEQQRIVAAIETQFTRLDAAVTALKRSQANLKRYRAAVLKAACEGRLVPTEAVLAQAEGRSYEPATVLLERILAERRRKWEAENPKKQYQEPIAPDTSALLELPEGWCWATTKQLTHFVTDGEHVTPLRSESGVLLLSARNIRDGYLSFETVDYISQEVFEQLSKRLKVQAGDVLLSCSGSVGRSCVVPAQPAFALVRSVAVLRPVINIGTYISLLIRSPFLQAQIDEKKTQTAQANIFQNKILTLIFPLPPLAEQQRIVTEVERRLSLIDQLEKTIEADLARANRLRQSILKQAFEGKLVPQDPTDESAAVLLERLHTKKND